MPVIAFVCTKCIKSIDIQRKMVCRQTWKEPAHRLHCLHFTCTLLALPALYLHYLHSTCTTCTFVPKTRRADSAAEDKRLREVDKAVTPTEKTMSRYKHDAVAVQICCAGSADSAGSVQVVQTRSAGSADTVQTKWRVTYALEDADNQKFLCD